MSTMIVRRVTFDDMRQLIHNANDRGEESPVIHARMLAQVTAAEANGDAVPGYMDLLNHARGISLTVLDAIEVLSRLAFVTDDQQLTRLEVDIVDLALRDLHTHVHHRVS